MDAYVKASKFLAKVLRHHPEMIGIRLDPQGWVTVTELVDAIRQSPHHAYVFGMTPFDFLREVVERNDKKRFEYSQDGLRIRACQGHSVPVDLDHKRVKPPEFLYHGTVEDRLLGIRKLGLKKMNRHAVHLSMDRETALGVGGRRGEPVLLEVQALRHHDHGGIYRVSANGVWLVDHVPPHFITFPS